MFQANRVVHKPSMILNDSAKVLHDECLVTKKCSFIVDTLNLLSGFFYINHGSSQ